MIPWLAAPDQHMVFPNKITFDTPEEQEGYVRNWVQKRTGLPCNFKIKFYPGHYAAEKCSILPVGDPTQYITDSEVRPWTDLGSSGWMDLDKAMALGLIRSGCLVFYWEADGGRDEERRTQ